MSLNRQTQADARLSAALLAIYLAAILVVPATFGLY